MQNQLLHIGHNTMYHPPTYTTLEIVYDADQAELGGWPVFGFDGFAVRLRIDPHAPHATDEMSFPEIAELAQLAILDFFSEMVTRICRH
jgi:hypothetical protein